MRAALANDIAPPEFQRVDPELARHDIGVALVGPCQLRNAKAAHRAGGDLIGVDLVGIDLHILNVVGSGRGKSRFLADARADICVSAPVPENLAFTRGDATGLGDTALDSDRGGMIGHDEKLLVHRRRDFHRSAHDQCKRRYQGFELDVGLGSEAAAEQRHAHPHPVFRPTEQARDLQPHERGHLAGRVDGDDAVTGVGD